MKNKPQHTLRDTQTCVERTSLCNICHQIKITPQSSDTNIIQNV